MRTRPFGITKSSSSNTIKVGAGYSNYREDVVHSDDEGDNNDGDGDDNDGDGDDGK